MTARRDLQRATGGPGERERKLLLVGRDDEFEGGVTRRIFDGKRPWAISRSISLLGALECLQSEDIDFVLLSHKFREGELELFVADARRNGFDGLILRVATLKESGSQLPAAALYQQPVPTMQFAEDPMHPMRIAAKVRRQREGWNRSVSFTAKQRAVLAHVSEGMTNHQVANQLSCSEGAVKAILQELFRKLEVRKRSQIVRVALENGLIEPARKPATAYLIRTPDVPPVSEPTAPSSEPLHVGDFIIDVAMHRVWVRGAETHLTPSEFQLLWILATHAGKLVAGSSLREMFWRNPTARQSDLRVLVGTLRAKIEVSKTPRYVITERFLGYRFVPSPS